MRVLQTFQLSEYFGTLLIAVYAMCKDVAYFFLLLSIFCLGFSCTLTPILFNGQERLDQGIMWAFWSIFGDINERARENAAKLTWLSGLAGGLLYTLSLFSNVLLVNLLIAVMGSTYEETRQASQKEWAYHRMNAVLEFDEVASLPPPLNLVYIFTTRQPKDQ